MKARIDHLARVLRTLPPPQITAIGLCAVLGLGVIDYLTPGPMSFVLFYMLAVAFVGWGAGKWHAIFVSAVSVALMTTVQIGLRRGAPQPFGIAVWNEVTRFAIFASAGWITSEITRLTRHLHDLVEQRTSQLKAETDQHKATAARLTDANERFEQLTNHIREVMWLTDVSKTRMEYISPAYERIWGRKCESLYQNPESWLENVHPDDREAVARSARTDQAAGNYDIEYRIIRPDGSARWIRDRAFPILNAQGQVYRLAGLAEDITARKRAKTTQDALLSLARKLSVAKAPLEAGRAILASADQIWNWDAASLHTYSPASDLLQPVVECDIINGKRQEVPPTRPAGPPTDRARRIIREGAQLILRKPTDPPLTGFIRFGDKSRPSASIMFAPLHREAQVVGVLSVQSYAPSAYTPEDLRTLQALADHCGAALDRIAAEEALRKANDLLEQRVQERTAEFQTANQALSKANAILQAVNEGTDNLICVKDAQGKILMANPAMARLLGKTEPELIGTDDLDSLPNAQQAAQIREHDRRIVANGRSETVEETIDLPGRQWHCLFTKSPYRDPTGAIIGTVGIGVDITERKRFEAVLRESERKLREAQRIGHLGYMDFDLTRRKLIWSEETYRMFGQEPEHFSPTFESTLQLVHPEDRARVQERLQSAIQNQSRLNIEHRMIRPDGAIVFVHSQAELQFDNRGNPLRLLGTVLDITDRKQVERALLEAQETLETRVQARTAELETANNALRDSEASLRALLDALPEPAMLLDRSGKFIITNPATARSLGIPGTDITGKAVSQLMPPSVAESRLAQLDRALANGEPLRFEDSHAGKYFINFVNPILNPTGTVPRVAVFALDITERKRSELIKEAFLSLGQKLSAVRTAREAGEAIFAAADRLWNWHCATLDIRLPETDGVDSVLNYDTVDGRRREISWGGTGAKLTPRMRRVMRDGAKLILRRQPAEPADDPVMIGDTSRHSMSIMCVPLRRQDQPLGVLSVQSYAPDAFSQADLQTLQALADYCAGSMERIQAETALRESEQTYRALIETTGTGYLILDPQGQVLDANAEYVRLTGHQKLSEIKGKSVLEWTAPHDRQRNATEVQKCLQTGTVRTLEVDYAGPDGALRPIEINATLVPTAKEARILSLCWDITERKNAEAALHQREELNRTILATAMDGFFTLDFSVDPQGAITDVNDAYCRMSGYCRDELLHKRIPDLDADESHEAFAQRHERIMASGAGRFETRHRCKDGRIIEVEVSASRLPGADARAFSFVRDITDRKRTEAALRASEERYRTLAESSPDAIFIVGRDLRVEYVNSPAAALWRRTPGEIIGRRQTELFPSELARRHEQVLQEVMQTGESFRRDESIPYPAGEVWHEVRLVPICDERNDISGVMGAVRDITERKRAEAAVRESEERYRTLFELCPDGILLEDTSGNVLEANKAICEVFGYPRDEFLRQNVRRFVPPEDHSEVEAHLAALQAGQRLTHEVWNLRKNGERCLMRLNEQPITLPGGRQAILVVARDITERKQTEEALRESEERYRSLINNLNVGVYRNTPGLHGHFIQVNPALARMHGYESPEEIQRARVSDLYQNPGERETFITELFRRGAVLNYELRLKRKDGTPIWGSVNAAVHRGPDGQVDWIDGVLEDITERKRAEDALRESEGLLRTFFDSPGALRAIVELTEDDILVVSTNTAQAAVYGRTVEEARSVSASQLGVPRAVIDLWREKFFQSQKTNEQVSFEYSSHFRAPGTWGMATVAPLGLGLSGRPRFGYVALDITKRKKAEQELSEALDLNRMLIQSSPVGIAAFKASGECILANEALAKITGGTVEQLLQQNFRRLESWRRHGMLKHAQEVLRTMQPWQGDIRSATSFGRECVTTIHIAPFVSTAELHLLVLVMDITDRKRAESLGQAQRDLGISLSLTSDLNTALDRLLDTALSIAEIDSGGVYLLNRTAETMDLAAYRGVSASFAKAVSHWPSDSPQMRLIQSGRPSFGEYRKLPIPRDAAQLREGLRGQALLPLAHKGAIIGALALSSHTVSEFPVPTQVVIEAVAVQAAGAIARIQAEIERRRLEQQILEITDREQVRIGQDIHDGLCQHLISLGFDANSLVRRLSDNRRSEAAVARRLARFLDQAITEARQLSRGLYPIRLETGGLGSALEELATATCERFQVQCRFVSRKPALVKTKAHAIHIYRIAQEALNNAIKHGRAGKILISLHARRHLLELRIEDDGIGLATDAARKKQGMGLHIMDYRARSIGGTLRLGPGARGGTVVSCCVPHCLS